MGSVKSKTTPRRQVRKGPEAQTPRRIIFVLGMHRSGTSMITRLINFCGAALPKTLMPARADNETGYWESLKGMLLNDQILAAAGLNWMNAGGFPEGWFESPQAKAFVGRIAALLTDELQGSTLAIFKDPRISRLFPLWREAAEKSGWVCSVVLMARDPREVAASLQARNDLSRPATGVLWLRYMLEAERESRGLPRVIATYDETLTDWRATVSKILTSLNIGEPSALGAIEREADSFVSVDRKHHAALSGGGVPEITLRLYRRMADAQDDSALFDSVSAALKIQGRFLPPLLEAAKKDGGDEDARWAQALDLLLGWRAAELDQELARAVAARQDSDRRVKEQEDRSAAFALALKTELIAVQTRADDLERLLGDERAVAIKAMMRKDTKLAIQSADLERMAARQAALKAELAAHTASRKSYETQIVRWALDHQLFDAAPGFDEESYLEAYPDVRQAVESGGLRSGFEHWVRWGFGEGRHARFLASIEI